MPLPMTDNICPDQTGPDMKIPTEVEKLSDLLHLGTGSFS